MLQYVAPFIFILVVSIVLFIVYNYWSYFIILKDQHGIDKFKTILTIISTIASVVFGSAVVLQVINYANQRKVEEIDYYSKLSREFLDEVLELFINNIDMGYYYEELFGINRITDKTKRNLIKEHAISMLIFSKSAKFAIFELESNNEEAKAKVHNWLGHVLDTLMNSEILRRYWTTEYKPKLSGPATQNYMKKYFNL
jgi:ribosomal protein L30E